MLQNLNAKEEMVHTLLSSETKQIVSQLFMENKTIAPIDSYDVTYRLYKVDKNIINLELAVQSEPYDIERVFDPKLGYIKVGTVKRYFDVIGYFNRNLEITILNEFVSVLSSLKNKGLIYTYSNIKQMSLIDSALIGACSVFTSIEAKKYKDARLVSNGLNIDLFMTFDGSYPQAFLDDKYGIDGALCAYFKDDDNKDSITINPMVQYKVNFDKLNEQRLLTTFNGY